MTISFTPSPDASLDVLRSRIEVGLTYPHGHPGIPGLPEGDGCPRCNAEQALTELIARATGRCIGRECSHPYAGTRCPDCGEDTPRYPVADEVSARRAAHEQAGT